MKADAVSETELECIRLLFTLAAEIVEEAHSTAMAAQLKRNSVRNVTQAVEGLRRTGRDLEAIADAIEVALPQGKRRSSP